MVANLSDKERAALLAELVGERFGLTVPWWEMHRRPKPIPVLRRGYPVGHLESEREVAA